MALSRVQAVVRLSFPLCCSAAARSGARCSTFRLSVSQKSSYVSTTARCLGALTPGPSTTVRSASSDATGLDDEEIRRKLNDFNDLFGEARADLMQLSDSIKEGLQPDEYEDDKEYAQASVEKALDFWTDLMSSVDEQQKGELMRSNGLKLQQIKQEWELLKDK